MKSVTQVCFFVAVLSLCMIGKVKALGKRYDNLGVYVFVDDGKWYFMGLVDAQTGEKRAVFAIDNDGKNLAYGDENEDGWAGGYAAQKALFADISYMDKIFYGNKTNGEKTYLYIFYKDKPYANEIPLTAIAQNQSSILTATVKLPVWEDVSSTFRYITYGSKWDGINIYDHGILFLGPLIKDEQGNIIWVKNMMPVYGEPRIDLIRRYLNIYGAQHGWYSTPTSEYEKEGIHHQKTNEYLPGTENEERKKEELLKKEIMKGNEEEQQKQEKLKKEKQEQEEQVKQKKLEEEKIERKKQEKLKKEILEKEKQKKEAEELERQDREETQRLEKEKLEREEAERLKKEKLEQERLAEQKKIEEQERVEKEKQEQKELEKRQAEEEKRIAEQKKKKRETAQGKKETLEEPTVLLAKSLRAILQEQ